MFLQNPRGAKSAADLYECGYARYSTILDCPTRSCLSLAAPRRRSHAFLVIGFVRRFSANVSSRPSIADSICLGLFIALLLLIGLWRQVVLSSNARRDLWDQGHWLLVATSPLIGFWDWVPTEFWMAAIGGLGLARSGLLVLIVLMVVGGEGQITTLNSLWVPITYWVQLVLGLPLLLDAKGFQIQRLVFLLCIFFSGFKIWDSGEVWVIKIGGSTTIAFHRNDSSAK